MAKDVIITPASGLIDFKDLSGNIDAKLQIDDTGNLTLTNTGGNLTIGDSSATIFIGDGVNITDIVFEQNGTIRGSATKTLNLGSANSNVAINNATINSGVSASFSSYVRANELRAFSGNQLIINSGESNLYATGQTGEIVYINSEGGIQINSSPDNWVSGWAGRKTATICDTSGNSSFPGSISATTINGTTGTFSSAIIGSTLTSNGAISGTTINGTTGTFSSAIIGSTLTSNGAISGTTITLTTQNQIRLKNAASANNYGVLHRLDTNSYYLLLTNLNDADGTFNALRPFTITASSGLVTIGNGAQINSLGIGTAPSGTTGEIRATNNITAYYSDDRLKTKLGTIENALGKIQSLSGFYYQANDIAQKFGYEVKKEVGVSAQEVQKVMPEVVAPAPIDDKYLTVRYEKLIPLLIEGIKEQQKMIEMQQNEIQLLKQYIYNLK